jgi:hypothetical protein
MARPRPLLCSAGTPARARLRWTTACALAGAAIWCWATGARAVAEAPRPGYRLIVNPSNPTGAVDQAFVSRAFLKKVRRWPSGATIEPVDLDPGSELRRRWSVELLGRPVEAVKSYWQQMIFSGRELPPPELDSDDGVVLFVLRRPGGVGYVSSGANLRGTKILVVK